MKFRYDKEDDALMIWFSKEKIDYAQQTKNIIMHFSKTNKPVLMEILEASLFLKETSRLMPSSVKNRLFA